MAPNRAAPTEPARVAANRRRDSCTMSEFSTGPSKPGEGCTLDVLLICRSTQRTAPLRSRLGNLRADPAILHRPTLPAGFILVCDFLVAQAFKPVLSCLLRHPSKTT